MHSNSPQGPPLRGVRKGCLGGIQTTEMHAYKRLLKGPHHKGPKGGPCVHWLAARKPYSTLHADPKQHKL